MSIQREGGSVCDSSRKRCLGAVHGQLKGARRSIYRRGCRSRRGQTLNVQRQNDLEAHT